MRYLIVATMLLCSSKSWAETPDQQVMQLSNAGQYANAEPLYKRSLAIREKQLGPDHPDTELIRDTLQAMYLMNNGARKGP